MSLSQFKLEQQLSHIKQQQLWRQQHPYIKTGMMLTNATYPYGLIDFASNDYLGLSQHPQVVAATADYLHRYGVGSGAAHLISGHHPLHQTLEEMLAKQTGYESALLFSSGYMANVGVIDALMKPYTKGGHVFADRLNHASLIDGVRQSGVKNSRFWHRDYSLLAQQLAQKSASNTKLIVSDHVFSMDGTIADVKQLNHLANKYEAAVMLDDAHGFMVQHDVPKVDIYMATLGKAIGTYGAFVAGSRHLIDYLQNCCRTFINTTASPPMMAAATLASLEVANNLPLRERLQQLCRYVHAELALQGWKIYGDASSPIVAIKMPDVDAALRMSDWLKQQGIFVVAIRPPTVPVGESRLRLTLSAAHTDEQINHLVSIFATYQKLYAK